MDMNEYQTAALSTAVYAAPNSRNLDRLAYTTLGLVGEAGEIANKVKKIIRDADGIISSEALETLQDELGDVLWYVATLAHELSADLNTIALGNVVKLADRKARNTIQGSGDKR